MDKIDLDAIISSIKMPVTGRCLNDRLNNDKVNIIAIKNCMKEAIHQALVLASEKAQITKVGRYLVAIVDKQSILDVEILIV